MTIAPEEVPDLKNIAKNDEELEAKYNAWEEVMKEAISDKFHGGKKFDLLFELNDKLRGPASEEEFKKRLMEMKERERYIERNAQQIAGKKLVLWDEDPNNIKPNTLITLYHGTEKATLDSALKEGIDVRFSPKSRQYYGTDVDRWGIYATPYAPTAHSFGGYILEIAVPAIHLEQPGVLRGGEESFAKEDEAWRKFYPNSFRPSLSSSLAIKGESQAIVKTKVMPNMIRSVTYWNGKDWVTVKPKELISNAV